MSNSLPDNEPSKISTKTELMDALAEKLELVKHLAQEEQSRDKPGSGLKFDDEKIPLHLIPPEFLFAIAEILAFGAKKYGVRNWESGIKWSRVYRACIGHLFAWFMGYDNDPETGKSHLWHAGCCIMFLIVYEYRGLTAFDDRTHIQSSKPPSRWGIWFTGSTGPKS